jgi:hypothetical protein
MALTSGHHSPAPRRQYDVNFNVQKRRERPQTTRASARRPEAFAVRYFAGAAFEFQNAYDLPRHVTSLGGGLTAKSRLRRSASRPAAWAYGYIAETCWTEA